MHKDGFSTTNQQLPPKESSTDENQGGNEPKIKCLCSNEHHLMNCDEFRSKSVNEKKEFVKKECLCWNCISKSHESKYCISKYSCRKEDCGKKHHTLLHEEKKAKISTSSHNTLQMQNAVTYLKVLLVVATNGLNQVKTNALLDTGSNSTLITSELTKQLNLKSISQKLEISNFISICKIIPSKIVDFQVSSNHHPENIIENA